jgi:predicted nucleotidyltransferase
MEFGLSEKVIERINEVFTEKIGVNRVVIYGSRAKGNYRKGSDIDLCIMDANLTLNDIIELAGSLDELMLPYEIDLSDYNKLTNENLKDHIKRVGRIFWIRSCD